MKELQFLEEQGVSPKLIQEVENFRQRLESEKEQFITEIMKGIKIYRQQEGFDIGVNYKIILENVYRPK